MPMVEKAKTQTSAKPKIDPAWAAKPSSLMSTKPPTAVMMPSVSSSGFKAVLDPLQRPDMLTERLRPRIILLGQECAHVVAIRGVGLSQRVQAGPELLPQLPVHRVHIRPGEMPAGRLLVDQRPFSAERTRLADRRQVRRGTFGTG